MYFTSDCVLNKDDDDDDDDDDNWTKNTVHHTLQVLLVELDYSEVIYSVFSHVSVFQSTEESWDQM